MRLATPLLILTLSFPAALAAQEGAAAVPDPAVGSPVAESPAEAVPAEGGEEVPLVEEDLAVEGVRGNHQVRSQFLMLLHEHPPELGRILALDPLLLSNEPFLARYPELAGFLAAHPEIRRNPHFYVPDVEPRRTGGALGDIVEAMAIFGSFLLATLAIGWFIRTLIEQKRWSRLARTQTEVHNKILDRFGTSEELLAYVKTPAGSRFLESAPIPLHADARPAPQSPPLPRSLWSLQVGVVVAAAAIGMLLVSLRFDEETAQGLFALGGIGLCLGLGFIASAAVSLVLARRLGLWATPDAGTAPSNAIDDTGFVG